MGFILGMQGWFNILKKNQVNTHISRIKRGKVHMIISMNAGNSIGQNPIPFHDNSKIGKEKKKNTYKMQTELPSHGRKYQE